MARAVWARFIAPATLRGDGPFIFAQVTHGQGVQAIADHLLRTWRDATGDGRAF